MAEVQIEEPVPEPIQEPEATEASGVPKVTTHFAERATLRGHKVAITSLQVDQSCELLVSGSRDRTALIWNLPKQQGNWATMQARLDGHNHFVSGVAFSSDASHVLTSSWDKIIRLWTVKTRSIKALFKEHDKDVTSVAFSPSNNVVVSCARDNTVKVWNILGVCKRTLPLDAWGACIACSPGGNDTECVFAVGCWDGTVKLWSFGKDCEEQFRIKAHDGRVSGVAFAPGGAFLVTGGSDRKVCVWNVSDGSLVRSLTAPAPINAISCCPTQAWVCAATYEGIAVFDIQVGEPIDLVQPDFPVLGKHETGRTPDCTCVAWQDDGAVLYSGYNNGEIRVWEVRSSE